MAAHYHEHIRARPHRTHKQICNLRANPLMLLVSCVNTPTDYNVFQNLHTPVARCSASCVNWALPNKNMCSNLFGPFCLLTKLNLFLQEEQEV